MEFLQCSCRRNTILYQGAKRTERPLDPQIKRAECKRVDYLAAFRSYILEASLSFEIPSSFFILSIFEALLLITIRVCGIQGRIRKE